MAFYIGCKDPHLDSLDGLCQQAALRASLVDRLVLQPVNKMTVAFPELPHLEVDDLQEVSPDRFLNVAFQHVFLFVLHVLLAIIETLLYALLASLVVFRSAEHILASVEGESIGA